MHAEESDITLNNTKHFIKMCIIILLSNLIAKRSIPILSYLDWIENRLHRNRNKDFYSNTSVLP